MQQIRISAPGVIEVAEAEPPEPGPDEVLLELHSAGICGGDLSLLKGTNAIARYPVVPGHECVARVVRAPAGAAGDGRRLTEGAYVVVYPTLSCGACRACAAGRSNQCAEMTVLGLSAPGGCFAERFTVPTGQCVPLPDDVGSAYGALVEPVAVGCHVVDRAEVRDGDTALVIGSGTIGICTAMVARARGVRRVLFADLHPGRTGLLERCGWGEFGEFGDFTTASGDALVAWTTERAGRVDLVYDTVTQTATANVAAEVLAGGGRYVAIGAAKPGHRLDLPYERMYARELAVVASRNYDRGDFRAAVDLIREGKVDPRPLCTAVFELAQVSDALAALTAHPADHLKVLLTRAELLGSGGLFAGTSRASGSVR